MGETNANTQSLFVVVLFLVAKPSIRSQGITITSNLGDIGSGKGWKLFNREASIVAEGGKRVIRFDEKLGLGVAWLEGSLDTHEVGYVAESWKRKLASCSELCWTIGADERKDRNPRIKRPLLAGG